MLFERQAMLASGPFPKNELFILEHPALLFLS
jgi:hypothetical protein